MASPVEDSKGNDNELGTVVDDGSGSGRDELPEPPGICDKATNLNLSCAARTDSNGAGAGADGLQDNAEGHEASLASAPTRHKRKRVADGAVDEAEAGGNENGHKLATALRLLDELSREQGAARTLSAETLREVAHRVDVLHYERNLPRQPQAPELPSGESIVARTWPELLRLLDLNSWEHGTNKFNTPFLFRGLPDSEFHLKTSLQRLGHPPGSTKERRVEKGILRSFMNYCHGALDSRASLFEWLALAQHHGCPTRILDFTYSPLTALHFACRDPSRDSHDGVVWCVDPRRCMDASETYRSLHSQWRRETHDSFWSICRTNQMLSLIDFACFHSAEYTSAASSARPFGAGAGIAEFDSTSRMRLLDKLSVMGDSLVFMEAPALHQRVTNQNHAFAFLTGKTACIDEWLEQRKHKHTYRRIVIAKALKVEVRQRLYSLGITERLLFPGLSGTSKWIKNYYTPTSADETATAAQGEAGEVDGDDLV